MNDDKKFIIVMVMMMGLSVASFGALLYILYPHPEVEDAPPLDPVVVATWIMVIVSIALVVLFFVALKIKSTQIRKCRVAYKHARPRR